MAEHEPGQPGQLNWTVVAFGGLLLVLAILAIPDRLVSAPVAAFILGLTFYMAHQKQETEVENPLLDELRAKKTGLDRRKYGRLRSSTDRLLDNVRTMNRIAIDGREGKLSPRHAHAELDRLAAKMGDLIDDIRKSAGIPTPPEEPSQVGRVVQPQVVLPKAKGTNPEPEAAVETAEPAAEPESTDEEMERLITRAEEEASLRSSAATSAAVADPTDEVESASATEEEVEVQEEEEAAAEAQGIEAQADDGDSGKNKKKKKKKRNRKR